MDDNVYCSCWECPYTDCKRHLRRLVGHKGCGKANVANIGGICRKYISWLVERVAIEDRKG